MTAYLLEYNAPAGTKKVDTLVVSAADETDAEAYAESQFSGDGAHWSTATVTPLADVASNAEDALVGWRFRVTVLTPAGAILEQVEKVGDVTDDDIDLILAALVVLLNATASIAGSSQAANILTISDIADAIGDHSIRCEVFPPVVQDITGRQLNQDVDIPGFTGAVVHEGIAAAVLTQAYAIDTYAVPTTYKRTLDGHTV